MKNFIAIFAAIALIFSSSLPAYSHSGGTNKYGCHAGSKPYHCHNKKDSSSGSSSKYDGDIGTVLLSVTGIIIVVGFFVFMFDGLSNENETISYDLEADPLNQDAKATATIQW